MPKEKKRFKKEFKRQLRLAIAAAIGFTIAFSWRDFIINLSKDWVSSLHLFLNVNLINLSSSLLITTLGVLLIVLSSRILE